MAISFHALVALDVVWSKLEEGREVGNVQGRRMRKRDFSADAKGCREACQRCFHETSSLNIKIPSIMCPLAVIFELVVLITTDKSRHLFTTFSSKTMNNSCVVCARTLLERYDAHPSCPDKTSHQANT